MRKKKYCRDCLSFGSPLPEEPDPRPIAERYPITPEEEKLLNKIHAKSVDSTVYNYGHILRKKHKKDIKKIYEAVEDMLHELLYNRCWRYGLQVAILDYYPTYKDDDRENFMLIQFLEEAKEYAAREELADEPEEDWFPFALFMALQVSDNPNFLARLYRYVY